MNRDDLLRTFLELTAFIRQTITAYSSALAVATLVLTLLFIIGIWFGLKTYKRLGAANKNMKKLLLHLDISQGLEKNLTSYLEMAAQFVAAPTFAFYVHEPKSNGYVLKAVRHLSVEFGAVRPSYSGLSPYKKEAYQPPAALPAKALPPDVCIVTEGEVPMLAVPVAGNQGMMRIGAIKRVKGRTRKQFTQFAEMLAHPLETVLEAERMKSKVELAVHSVQALKSIGDIATDPKATLAMLLGAVQKTTGAKSIIVLQAMDGHIQVQAAWMEADNRKLLQNNQSDLQACYQLLERQDELLMKRGEAGFNKLPPALIGVDTRFAAALRVDLGGSYAVLIACLQETPAAVNDMRLALRHLRTVGVDMARVLNSQLPVSQLSGAHVQLLKELCCMMDDASPYTAGYSEQMSRYAVVIAQELGMAEEEIRDVGLAAYLSNIGVLGLSSDLYQKEGRFTEMEYELMKLHAEVGAMIVGVTVGNTRVSSYILHHHERIDGGGYPHGIRGEQIPLGSRIIAVVQTFLAKINGRPSRDPLRFDQALKTLEAASGTQLDERVVRALIAWFRRKQAATPSGRALGSCSDMCCAPRAICEKCPAYGQSALNCWEVEGNLCLAHGKSCETCFVKTEMLARRTAAG